jgi:hypothetical protein
MLYLVKFNENTLKYVDLRKQKTNLMRNEIIYICAI